MADNILIELEKKMRERNIKIPALSRKLSIPSARMYKWYQEGSNPKLEDAIKIWDWINGKNSTNDSFATDPNYLIGIIKTQAEAILKQQETISAAMNALISIPKKTA